MSWITLTITASFICAAVNVTDKYILSKLVTRPVVPVIITGTIGFIGSLIIFAVHGIEPLSAKNIVLAFAGAGFQLAMIFLYFNAVKLEEISKIVPLFYMMPFFTLLIAGVFLGEIFTPAKYLGIALLVSGAILISLKKPFAISFGRAFWFVILGAFFLAISQVIVKYLLGFASFWTIFAYTRTFVFVMLIPVILPNRRHFKELYKEKGIAPAGIISLNESLAVVGILLFTTAMSKGPVTLVAALSSIQPFFVLLFAIFLSLVYPNILTEETNKSAIFLKAISIIIMFAGAILIR